MVKPETIIKLASELESDKDAMKECAADVLLSVARSGDDGVDLVMQTKLLRPLIRLIAPASTAATTRRLATSLLAVLVGERYTDLMSEMASLMKDGPLVDQRNLLGTLAVFGMARDCPPVMKACAIQIVMGMWGSSSSPTAELEPFAIGVLLHIVKDAHGKQLLVAAGGLKLLVRALTRTPQVVSFACGVLQQMVLSDEGVGQRVARQILAAPASMKGIIKCLETHWRCEVVDVLWVVVKSDPCKACMVCDQAWMQVLLPQAAQPKVFAILELLGTSSADGTLNLVIWGTMALRHGVGKHSPILQVLVMLTEADRFGAFARLCLVEQHVTIKAIVSEATDSLAGWATKEQAAKLLHNLLTPLPDSEHIALLVKAGAVQCLLMLLDVSAATALRALLQFPRTPRVWEILRQGRTRLVQAFSASSAGEEVHELALQLLARCDSHYRRVLLARVVQGRCA